jgi:hypothetical protein
MNKLKKDIVSIRNIMDYSFHPKDERDTCDWKGCKSEGINGNLHCEEDDMLCNKHLKQYYVNWMNS